jgi:hypothetical protein
MKYSSYFECFIACKQIAYNFQNYPDFHKQTKAKAPNQSIKAYDGLSGKFPIWEPTTYVCTFVVLTFWLWAGFFEVGS